MRPCGSGLVHVAAFLIVPRCPVVGLSGGIESGVKTVFRQFETLMHHERSAGVIEQVIPGYAVVLDGVINHSAQKCNVSARADLQEKV